MSARGLIGAGDVYMNPIVNGVAQGWVGPYESTKFEIKPNVDLKEQTSKSKDNYGQVIETVNVPKPSDLNVEFAELNKDTMNTALLGTQTAVSQVAGAVADEQITATVLDVWVPLSGFAVDTVVVKDSTGATTYVDGEDYIVNDALGWVKPLSTGSIAAAATLKVSFNKGAVTGTDIAGGSNANVRVKFKFDGKNLVDGAPLQVDVYEAVIAPSKALDFLSDNFNSVSLTCRMKTPQGFTSPFKVRTLTA